MMFAGCHTKTIINRPHTQNYRGFKGPLQIKKLYSIVLHRKNII